MFLLLWPNKQVNLKITSSHMWASKNTLPVSRSCPLHSCRQHNKSHQNASFHITYVYVVRWCVFMCMWYHSCGILQLGIGASPKQIWKAQYAYNNNGQQFVQQFVQNLKCAIGKRRQKKYFTMTSMDFGRQCVCLLELVWVSGTN